MRQYNEMEDYKWEKNIYFVGWIMNVMRAEVHTITIHHAVGFS